MTGSPDPHPRVAAVVAPAPDPPVWLERLDGALVVGPEEVESLTRARPGLEAVLVDGLLEAPLAVARRLRRLLPDLQLILVASANDGGAIRRSVLFTPGLGEPWVVDPDEVQPDLLDRASNVTRRRRAHARQLDRVSGRPTTVLVPDRRTRRLSDQYLATLLELLPDPVFAVDDRDTILFANPAARAAFRLDDPAGKPISTALDPVFPQDLDRLLRGDEKDVIRYQVRLRHHESGERIYNAVIASVRPEASVRALVLHDVTDQVHAQDALEAQAAELEAQTLELAARTEQSAHQAEMTRELAAERTAVLGNIADGVIIVDGDGRISFVNETAARIHGAEHLGIRPEDWADAYNLLTLDGQPYPSHDLPLARALRENRPVRDAEWLIRRPDGVVVHAQGSAAPVLDVSGQPMGAVLTVRDVTEERRREAERERLLAERDRALTELQEAMRHRSRFYASMSHELRTPINAIIGYNQLLLDELYGEVPDAQRAALDRIDRAARHLLELVNDVLDLSKIEAGKMTIEPEPVPMSDLILDLQATMEPLARQHDVQIRFELDQACHEPLHTDPRRVRQILMNLLSNAIRFGAGRPVDVECRRDHGGARIAVRDQGPGIERDRVEEIFSEFVQLHGGDRGGTGLGLPIARTLARFLDGEIEVKTAPGEGSTFTLVLPDEPPPPGTPPEPTS